MICSTFPSLLTAQVTALRRLQLKLPTIFCVLWMMVMWLSWPFSICLLLSILSTTIFPYTDFNFSTVFLAPFCRGLLVRLRLWLWKIGVQDLRMFPSVSHRAQFLVLSSSFFTLHFSPLWLKLILFSTSQFACDTQLLHSCPPDQIHASVLTMQTCISDLQT